MRTPLDPYGDGMRRCRMGGKPMDKARGCRAPQERQSVRGREREDDMARRSWPSHRRTSSVDGAGSGMRELAVDATAHAAYKRGAGARLLAALLLAIVSIALLAGAGTAEALEATFEGTASENDAGLSSEEAAGQELSVQDDYTSWYTDVADSDGATYTIGNANEFAVFSQIVNGTHGTISQDSFEGDTVVLSSNIILSSASDLSPIGTEEHPFAGTFDGDSENIWTLRGFSMSVDEGSYLGIFGYVTGDIQNVQVNSASITVTVGEGEGTVVSNIGVLVGYCAGSIDNCTVGNSTVSVTSSQDGSDDARAVIRNVGGVAGCVDGDVTDCTLDSSSKIEILAYGDPGETDSGAVNTIAENIGGIVGRHGGNPYLDSSDDDPSSAGTVEEDPDGKVYNVGHGDISGCTNAGSIYVTALGTYWNERWYETSPAVVGNVGGIAGYSIGNISDCENSGNIGFPINDEGSSSASNGTTTDVGGIVGSLRGYTQSAYVGDYDNFGWFDNGEGEDDSAADELTITDCTNTGNVNAYNVSGGIVGASDVNTLITRCSNSGTITVWRWNKPQPGGIAANTYGDVTYCYNSGEVATKSSSGGYASGYYAAGIVSMLYQYTSVDGDAGDLPVVSGCYNVGMIRASGDYRQGAIVGMNEGTVQYCAYLEGCVPDASSREYTTGGNDESYGNIISCYEYKSSYLQSGDIPDDDTPSAIALMNSLAPDNGWTTYFVPSHSTSYVYPVLNGSEEECQDPIDLTDATVTLTLSDDAVYSASGEPSPTVTATLSDGTVLLQGVDFKVVPEEGATAVGGTYSATIEGIGDYCGTSSASVSYTIAKADLGDQVHQCSIVVESVYFNWVEQYPDADTVVVYDSAGGVIPSDQYTISYPDEKDGSNYVDAGSYNVTVTATDDSDNYEGSLTQEAFTIQKAPLYSRLSGTITNVATLTSVIYGDDDIRYWITEDEDGNEITAQLDDPYFTYTGEEIKPVAYEITYLGVQLTEGVDYINIYGNVNAEDTEVDGEDVDLVNVTDPDDPLTLSVHYKSGSNFSNWINVAYYIVAADIADCTITANDQPYTGTARNSAVSVTLNGHELEEGVDYKVEYEDNVEVGTATYTVYPLSQDEGGSGNLEGDPITGTFEIVEGGGTVTRIGGSDRYLTAALEALEAFDDGCDTVIIASGQDFPDALAATSLAGGLDCPILLTQAAGLSSSAATAIEELGASKAIIVGGESSVSEDALDDLEDMGLSVDRVKGDDRYKTANEIYTYGLTAGDDGSSIWGDHVIIASGTTFADALSVSPLAYSEAYPIFLTGKNNGLSATLATSSRNLIRDSDAVGAFTVGGTSSVSSSTISQMNSIFGEENVEPLYGDNRYETSVAIAEYCTSEGYLTWDGVALASGENFPDALAGSVLQGRTGSVMLLVDDADANVSTTTSALSDATSEITGVRIFGGTSSVSRYVLGEVVDALQWNKYTYETVSVFGDFD